MSRWTRGLEITSNIAILLVAIAIGIVLVKDHRLGSPQVPSELKQGDKVAGFAEVRYPKTLVLALSTDCHFCNQSAPFYQALSHIVDPKRVHLIAVFPQSVETARAYLQEKDIAILDVQHRELRSISVGGTPTLILLDNSGRILKSWFGALDKPSEELVIQQLKS
jgi:thiol-disulfide isomerase/thioredoxin